MHVNQLFDLTGKIALVTGGSRGLGLEIAEGLAEAGASVIITGRRREWLDSATAELEAAGATVLAVEADVADPEGVAHTIRATVERFGSIDILVNNAGGSWASPSLELPLERWKQIIDVNLTGLWLMSQAVAPVMIERGGGRIINIGSIMGQVGVDPAIQDAVSYSASKGAVEALTRDLAVKWARYNININTLAPGYFRTRMTDFLFKTVEDRLAALSVFNRTGQEGELKGAAVFLASPAASFITGQTLNVDGGSTIH
jgi:NAD(P)-dependent dehydrogenase (short-subunit alcohol dehydrogenase family)